MHNLFCLFLVIQNPWNRNCCVDEIHILLIETTSSHVHIKFVQSGKICLSLKEKCTTLSHHFFVDTLRWQQKYATIFVFQL